MKEYLFYLSINDGEQFPVNPIYKEDMAIDYNRESGQRFMRPQLSGKLTFVGVDYDAIINADFDAKFNVYIEIYKNGYEPYYKGKFFRTDCDINQDDKSISVQPSMADEYDAVIAGLEKEYNILELPIKVNAIKIDKRPLVQIYVPGDNVIGCFLGGTWWEQTSEEITNQTDLINKYHFQVTEQFGSVQIEELGGAISGTGGVYSGTLRTETAENTVSIAGDLYNDSPYKVVVWYWDNRLANQTSISWSLVRLSDDVILYAYSYITNMPIEYYNDVTYTMEARNDGTGSVKATLHREYIYARLLLDKATFKGQSTYPLTSEDMGGEQRGYNYVIGYKGDMVAISSRVSTTPTEWGRNPQGGYYLPPQSSIFTFYPVSRTNWSNVSYWYYSSLLDEQIDEAGRKSFKLRDAYELASVINALLQQIAPGITHEPTPEYSEFLYSVTNPLELPDIKLYVTPKTNIIVGEYKTPAQKAPATLKTFLDALKNTMQLYWHIEDNKLRIEHIYWYKNGGTYGDNPDRIGIDTTQLINPRNKKAWSFATNKYNFAKSEMPERYQFSWADEVSTAFKGEPIEVLSQYVQEGNIEDINIANITTDIDIMMLNPSNISPEGFALMGAVNSQIATEIYDSFTNMLMLNAGELKEIPITANAQSAILRYSVSENIRYGFRYSGGALTRLLPSNESSIKVAIPVNATHLLFESSVDISMFFYGLFAERELELPYMEETIGTTDYRLQNGYLSMIFLQPNYWLYDMPANQLKVNKRATIAKGIKREKKQNITIPVGYEEIDTNKLIKTELGEGEIEKISINLSSRIAKINLAYDTE